MVNTELHNNYLILVLGPTASGKTAMAIELAKAFDAEIISCDSRQFYREMSIGTAKPSVEELSQVPHHFIDNLSILGPDYSVGDYEKEVLAFLKNYYKSKKVAVLVGGSGLFARIVCEGVDQYPEVPEGIREELQKLLEERGIEALQAELKEADPAYFQKVDLNNPHRIIRALEICRATGKAFSSFQQQAKEPRFFKCIKLAIDWDRALLYERINKRVDIMFEQGLEMEAKALLPFEEKNALQTVGYKELFDYFKGLIDLKTAIELIKQNSRRYAKRQMTWLRKEKDLHWITASTPISEIEKHLKEQIEQLEQ